MYSAKGRLVSTFLAVILILGQLAFVHHTLDLGGHADGEPCILCLLSAGLDHGLIQNHPPAEIQPTRGLGNNWQGLPILFSVTKAFLARAPPA
ncbi:hypothetical protein N9985_01435 [Gammaproteobacteria bacterium]|jgi:hypothetical protein|nr:hypothetical protein [Gammaproteobacteria bacterium]